MLTTLIFPGIVPYKQIITLVGIKMALVVPWKKLKLLNARIWTTCKLRIPILIY